MTELEYAIVAALRADAEEASVKTDTPHEYETLTSRLDEADAARRRRRWVTAAIAVAAAAVVLAFAAVVRPAAGPPASDSSPSPSPLTAGPFTSVAFVPTVSWNPPAWTTTLSIRTSERTGHATWVTSGECEPRCAGMGFTKLRSVKPFRSTEVVSVARPADYIAYVRSMDAAGIIRLTGEKPVTVGSLAGTYFTWVENQPLDDVFGCQGDDGVTECYELNQDWASQVIVLDDGGETLTVASTTPLANPDRALYEAQFDAALATVRFTSG